MQYLLQLWIASYKKLIKRETSISPWFKKINKEKEKRENMVEMSNGNETDC